MSKIDWKRQLATLAVVVFGGWEAFHWLNDVAGRDPWTFALGFAIASLIFGFWGSSAPPVVAEKSHAPRNWVEDAADIEGLNALLETVVGERQEESDRAKKAAERIARYNAA